MTETPPTAPRPNAPLAGARATADMVAMWLLMLFLLLGVLQIFLAGVGVFDLHGAELGSKGETAFDPHRYNGFLMEAVALLILVAALVARASSRTVWMTVALLVLTAVLQSVLADLGEDSAFVGGLHALDGLVILGIAGFLHGTARRRQRAG